MKKTTKWTPKLMLLALFCTLAGFIPAPPNKLVGIWELMMEGSPTGLLKIFATDGGLTSIGLDDSGFGISQESSYENIADGVYVEKVKRSSHAPAVGTQTQVRYQIVGDTSLILQFKVGAQSFQERYKRLRLIPGN